MPETASAAAALLDGAHLVLFFFLYGILGWMAEVSYAALTEHRLVNRGFLCGPICPIYGFGMLALLFCIRLVPGDAPGWPGWVRVFFIGMFVTTVIELVGGWALFKIYHTRWWDYSNMRFNLGGYICPQFSLLWGLGSVVMVKLVHPLLERLDFGIPLFPLLLIDGVLLLGFGVDVGVSTAAAVGLNEKLREIDDLRSALRTSSDKLTDIIGGNALTLDTLLEEPKLQLTLAAMEGRTNAAEAKAELTRTVATLRAKLDALSGDAIGARRLMRAFPDMRSATHGESLRTARHYARRLRSTAGAAKQAAGAKLTAAKDTAKEKIWNKTPK